MVDSYSLTKLASTRENQSSGFANNKVADQPAHTRSLISAFVIRFLEVSYLGSLRAKFQISSLSLLLTRLIFVLPCRKPRGQIFSRRGPFNGYHVLFLSPKVS